PNVSTLEMFTPQTLNEIHVEVTALACAFVKQNAKSKIFQVPAKPWVSGNRKTMLAPSQHVWRNQLTNGSLKNALGGPSLDLVLAGNLESQFNQTVIEKRQTCLQATSHCRFVRFL